ncbi:MAG: hypothetical protein UE295_07600 [Acutalibacteraceae bacterium]|nr:hypothetical protein [Acutalibacteraceae bacterium]
MKRNLRIIFLSIGILVEVAYLIFSILSICLWTEIDDFVPLSFLVILTVHAVSALTVTVAGIVRAVKNRKWVLISGFFMQLWLLWMAFSALIFIVIPVFIPVVFMVLGVFILVMCYVIAKLAKNPPKRNINPIFKHDFIISAEESIEDAISEYCKLFNKKEYALTDDDFNTIYDYSFNWVLYLVIWVIKNDYYSDSFRYHLGDALIAEVKAGIISPEKLLYKTNGQLTNIEVCEAIKPFLSVYSESADSSSYWNDYLEVIKYEQSRFAYVIPKDGEFLEYCIDFNINIYYGIEDRINRAYYYFKERHYPTTTL